MPPLSRCACSLLFRNSLCGIQGFGTSGVFKFSLGRGGRSAGILLLALLLSLSGGSWNGKGRSGGFGSGRTLLDLLALLLSLSGGSWNGKGRSGGFGGGRTLLDFDSNRQADFFFAILTRHLARNSFIAALCRLELCHSFCGSLFSCSCQNSHP